LCKYRGLFRRIFLKLFSSLCGLNV
jgi:hypothetical protein